MKILKATKKDLKELSKVYSEVYSEKPYNEKWSEKNAYLKIKEYFENGIIFIAKEENKIVGGIIGHLVIWDKYQNAFGDEFFVLKEFRGKGIGKKLAVTLENYFRKKKAKYFSMNANPKSLAYKMYLKSGFHKSKNFVCLEKRL